MAITATERNDIIKLTTLMFNAAPGEVYLSQIVAIYEGIPGTATVKLQTLGNVLGGTDIYKSLNPNFQTAEEFAAEFLTPLGLQNDQFAKDFITSKLAAGL